MSSRHIQPHGDWLHPWEQQGSRLAFSRVNFTSTLVGGSQARVNSSNLGWKMFCQLSLAANNANDLGQRQKWVTQLIAVLPFPQLPTLLASKEESIMRIFFFLHFNSWGIFCVLLPPLFLSIMYIFQLSKQLINSCIQTFMNSCWHASVCWCPRETQMNRTIPVLGGFTL